MKSLIFLNPYAKGGRLFSSIYKHKRKLEEILGNIEFFGSTREDEVQRLKNDLISSKYSKIIIAGGDGTINYVLNNFIIPLNLKIPLGNLPIGTGSDWARALFIPKKLQDAAKWLAQAQTLNCDLGLVEYKVNGGNKKHYFLNIASFGLSGKVASFVNKCHSRGRSVFLRATIITLFTYIPSSLKIVKDGNLFFEGKNYLVAIANGPIFGGGMVIAPQAKINDGIFDLVLVKSTSFFSFLKGLFLVFRGKHLNHPAIVSSKGESFEIFSEKNFYFEMDGEDHITSKASIIVKKNHIPLLVDLKNAPII